MSKNKKAIFSYKDCLNIEQYILLRSQWDKNGKNTSFTERAFCFDNAVMRVHHVFYITQTKTESFYIMDIAGMCR